MGVKAESRDVMIAGAVHGTDTAGTWQGRGRDVAGTWQGYGRGAIEPPTRLRAGSVHPGRGRRRTRERAGEQRKR